MDLFDLYRLRKGGGGNSEEEDLGTIELNSNGTYTVKGYSTAIVDIDMSTYAKRLYDIFARGDN